jgi:hypothetical protein
MCKNSLLREVNVKLIGFSKMLIQAMQFENIIGLE